MPLVAEAIPDETPNADAKVDNSKNNPSQPNDIKPISAVKLFSMASSLEFLVLAFGLLNAAGWGFCQVAVNILFGDMIDGLGGTMISDFTKIIDKITIRFCYLGLVTLATSGICGAVIPWFSEHQYRKMQILYLDLVLHQDISWFDTHDVPALPAQLKEDMDVIKDAFEKMGNTCMGISAFFSAYVLAFIKSWQLTLVLLVTVPAMAFGSTKMAGIIEGAVAETQSWYSAAASTVEESLYAMRTVVAFGRENKALDFYNGALELARKAGVKSTFRAGFWLGYIWGVMFMSYAVAFYAGMLFKYHGVKNPSTGNAWTPGNILAVFFCVFTGSFMVGNAVPGFAAFNKAKVAGARFFALLESKPIIQCRGTDNRVAITSIETMELKSVKFSYPARPDRQVLHGISLTITKGQKVALVGESGCGKSTVVAMLARFYNPAEGIITFNGEDVKKFSVPSIRKLIGYVGQEPVLFAGTVNENIMSGNPIASKQMLKQVMQDAELGFVKKLPEKGDTFVGSGGNQFSGGQKQRIAIARALIKQPSVLLLDEATSALDNASERMIQGTLERIKKSVTDITMVSIAHRLSTIRDSDVIFVLKEGQVVEQGVFSDLLAAEGEFSSLAAAQSGAYVEEQDLTDEGEKDFAVRRASVCSCSALKLDGLEAAQKEEIAREKEIAKKYKTPWTRIFGYGKPELPCIVPGFIGALLNGGSIPLCAVILSDSMDKFFLTDREKMKEELTLLCIYFIIIGIANWLGQIAQFGFFGILGNAMTKRIRVALFTQFLRQEIGFHDDPSHTPGQLAAAVRLWAFRIKTFADVAAGSSSSACALFVGLGIAFAASWQMSLALLGSIPVMMVTQVLQVTVMMGGASKEAASKSQAATQIVSDSVQAARTVQACGMESQIVNMYSGLLPLPSVMRVSIKGLLLGVSSSMPMYILAAGFWIASKLMESGHADFVGVLKSFMGILFAAFGGSMCLSACGDMTKAKVAVHDMCELLDRQTQIDGMDPIGSTPSTTAKISNIIFKGVTFVYPFRAEVQVLRDVNFRISAGQSVGLVGPSGGGKSTIMSLLQRFYDPQDGQVLIGIGNQQIPLSDLNVRWWRQTVGFVGQEPILFDTTIKDNVLYGVPEATEITPDRLEQCKIMANLNFIDAPSGKGWDTQVGPRGNRLSGGQKQRVAICRALVRDPAILLLDEATSALDNQSEKIVQRALETARLGRTSFAIAHRLSTIVDCDVILVTAEGTIVEHGQHDDLIQKQGVYYSLAKASDLPSDRLQARQSESI